MEDSDSDHENASGNSNATPQEDPNFVEGAGINYTIVRGSKKNAKLVKFKGYLYRRRGCPRIDKKVTYLRCNHLTTKKAGPCRAAAVIRDRLCTEKDHEKEPHTCAPKSSAQVKTEKHELTTRMKERAINEGTPLQVHLLNITNSRAILYVFLNASYSLRLVIQTVF